jgi:hypothetical protein
MSQSLASPPLHRIKLGEDESGVRDRVHADVVSAAVRRSPAKGDVDPDESTMRGADRETRRLRQYRSFGANAGCQSARIPRLSYSSSTTAAITNPFSLSVEIARAAAAHIAAMPPFMSAEPRP